MADIAKLNGIGIAELAKIWGVDVANIASVMGLNISNPNYFIATLESPTELETSSSMPNVLLMDSTHAVLCYVINNAAIAVCLTINDTTITAGTPFTYRSASTGGITITKMDNTHLIVCHSSGINPNYTYVAQCLILDNITNTITSGSESLIINGYPAVTPAVDSIDSTHAIVCGASQTAPSYGYACYLTLSGDIITPETPVSFTSTSMYNGEIRQINMDSSNSLVVYKDISNSNYGTVRVLGISGSIITPGYSVVFESAKTTYIDVVKLNSTQAVVIYCKNDYVGFARLFELSEGIITVGDAIQINNYMQFKYARVVKFNETTVAVFSVWWDPPETHSITFLNIVDSVITSQNQMALATGQHGTIIPGCCLIDVDRILLAYVNSFVKVACVSVAQSSTPATSAIDQVNTTSLGAYYTAMLTGWQSFTSGVNGYLTHLAFKQEMAKDRILTIYNGEGIGGTVLHSQTLAAAGLARTFHKFALSTPIAITAESIYTMQFAASDGTSLGFYLNISSDEYPRGRMNDLPDYDWLFVTYVTS